MWWGGDPPDDVGWVTKQEKMRLGREEGQKEERNSNFKGQYLGSDLDIKDEVGLG